MHMDKVINVGINEDIPTCTWKGETCWHQQGHSYMQIGKVIHVDINEDIPTCKWTR